jgi:hypothetical protein
MNLKSFPSLDRGASSTRAHPHAMGQHKLINRSIVASLLSLAAVATVSQPEKAGAVDLNFATRLEANNATNLAGANLGNGYTGNVIRYTNVATNGTTTIDARITATPFGTGYSFVGHLPNYSTATGQPAGDAGFIYQTNTLGAGGMTYTIDLFVADATHSFTTAYTAPDLRFSVYDVDGEPSQNEAVRVAKGTDLGGLAGYQVGTSGASLIAEDKGTSYLFSGRNANQLESDSSSAALLYFQNVSSVTFQFEADTTGLGTGGTNGVFSAIDGDVSLIGNNSTNFDTSGHATPVTGFGTYQVATKIPEPFSIIGSLIGGGVAFGMRKKLKATSK